ncbi:DNA gyrase inhibitor YacG [Aliiroseovarius sp. YM-037]|uniref:DNA gyrase inhibitor YacG n=1 Tax=Aliiroseovarius sp. YM-037 TaxID=3341728 RepID=UPI003A7FDDDC
MICPICQKESDKKYRPFCSKRCADIDLGHWFDGTYTAPSTEEDDVADEPETPEQRTH